MGTESVTIKAYKCTRCGRDFFPLLTVDGQVVKTKRCRWRDCSSPYYDRPLTRINKFWDKHRKKKVIKGEIKGK